MGAPALTRNLGYPRVSAGKRPAGGSSAPCSGRRVRLAAEPDLLADDDRATARDVLDSRHHQRQAVDPDRHSDSRLLAQDCSESIVVHEHLDGDPTLRLPRRECIQACPERAWMTSPMRTSTRNWAQSAKEGRGTGGTRRTMRTRRSNLPKRGIREVCRAAGSVSLPCAIGRPTRGLVFARDRRGIGSREIRGLAGVPCAVDRPGRDGLRPHRRVSLVQRRDDRSRGHVGYYSLAYPAFAGGPLSLLGLPSGIVVLQALQALVMSTVAIPVYVWGRRLMSPSMALVAAGLCVLAPAMAYSGLIMSESLYYPLAGGARRARLRRRAADQFRLALLTASVTLAAAVRLQALVLVPTFAVALVLDACMARDRRRIRLFSAVLAGAVDPHRRGRDCEGWGFILERGLRGVRDRRSR